MKKVSKEQFYSERDVLLKSLSEESKSIILTEFRRLKAIYPDYKPKDSPIYRSDERFLTLLEKYVHNFIVFLPERNEYLVK